VPVGHLSKRCEIFHCVSKSDVWRERLVSKREPLRRSGIRRRTLVAMGWFERVMSATAGQRVMAAELPVRVDPQDRSRVRALASP
jgi:hypothetical protein